MSAAFSTEETDPLPGQRLRAARQGRYEATKDERFRSARHFALSIGVGVSTYVNHENGTRNFPAQLALRYAKALNVPVGSLLSDVALRQARALDVSAEAALLPDPEVPIVGAIRETRADEDVPMFDGLSSIPFNPEGLVAHIIDGDFLYPRYSRGDRLLHEDFKRTKFRPETVHGCECIVLLRDGSKVVRQVIMLKGGSAALVAYDGSAPTLTADIVAAAPVRYVERAPPRTLKKKTTP
jgi:transcriptional regulator with XRE-family HTH domain